MQIKFCGAAREVTGSSHLLILDNGYTILLDCGLYQGQDEDLQNLNRSWHFKPYEIDCVVLSHAHIDHCGRLPMLVRDGFKGNIYCTHATRDLCAILLLDSAKIQERDTEYSKRHKKQSGGETTDDEPLYTEQDVRRAMQQFITLPYERPFNICSEVKVMFRDNGHILGSASVTLKIEQEGKPATTFGFTGDIGRPNRPILRDPIPMPHCDYLICESTYGDRLHKSNPDERDALLKIIKDTCLKNHGKLLIPAFSVGRTQELIYALDRLEHEHKLPRVPVYVDSPLSTSATQIYLSHPDCFDADIMRYMLTDPNPFGFQNLRYIRRVEESKTLNYQNEASIIISASGMANAGRIKHHLRNNLEKTSTTVLMVGYCAPGTLGRRLRDGEPEVRIFGETINVNATIEILESFSAHGDQKEMLDFIENQDRDRLQQIFLVHGEYESQKTFKTKIEQQGFKNVQIPQNGETFEING
ncbi:MAG: MBL fold metallo-hydrolase [Chitinophagales bacterium]|jgi:metallo-beta-lactamase family protein|nr:MBL fold metallo-hydrolase [Sphingobacteriales bacterium]MBP9141744.1 MBL fold metallo-hydrolase [Chitinophagales bacterium]MDA0199497.1 MBL fold metallo-hydrolase [Bacteroidota bacterium]MBK6889400.1 MBL fold metallo-hydrolase [Sphingobacteriales bacterium]MBK8679724.1 MBL fold metallo-hydrolase [Sphingobacteriales bacterium]